MYVFKIETPEILYTCSSSFPYCAKQIVHWTTLTLCMNFPLGFTLIQFYMQLMLTLYECVRNFKRVLKRVIE